MEDPKELAQPFTKDHLAMERMPGHWVLAQMGKRVLRPGGMELTRAMLDALAIGSTDRVVELAPGLGATAALTLARGPESYIAVERDQDAAALVRSFVERHGGSCLRGTADDTGLPGESATVVYGEAMLTMQTSAHKTAIVREAARVLEQGGRYGIHELCLAPDDLDEEVKTQVLADLSREVHVGVRPLTLAEWRALLESEGFHVQWTRTASMHLLEPRRLLRDEGLIGGLCFAFNVLRSPVARQRVRGMRRVFRTHENHTYAVSLVATKA